MPTTHFKKWAEYFYECYKDTQVEPNKHDAQQTRQPGYWKYFMMSNMVYMATRRKFGAEKAKFNQAISDAPTILEKVIAFQSDPKLVEFAKKVASDLFNDDAPVPMKSKQMALNESAKGDRFMEMNDLESALYSYNNAILKVPPKEYKLLLKLYHKRAQVLMETYRIDEALMDVDSIVLHEKTTKETSLKLLEATLEVCNQQGWMNLVNPLEVLINMVQEGDEYRKAPRVKRNQIPYKEEDFQGTSMKGSSEAIKLAVVPGKGRSIVAARDIDAGEQLIMEKAFINHLVDDARKEYCYSCTDELNGRFDPCLKCDEVRYCSEACRDESWDVMHKHECGLVDALEFITSGYDALKPVMIGGYEKAIEVFRNPKPLEYWTENPLDQNYESYGSLFAHTRGVQELQLISFILQATIAAEIARLMKIVPEDVDFTELTTLLFSNILRNKTNSWAIYSQKHTQNGSAIFITFSMPNHSCEPNSHQVYHGNTMISSATRPIKEGEEVSMSYGPSAGSMDVIDRQHRLRENYAFECDCNGCMRDLSRYAVLNYETHPPDYTRYKRPVKTMAHRPEQTNTYPPRQTMDTQSTTYGSQQTLTNHQSYGNAQSQFSQYSGNPFMSERQRRYAQAQAQYDSGLSNDFTSSDFTGFRDEGFEEGACDTVSPSYY